MNATLDVLLQHRSYRDYTDEPVSDATLDAIIEATHRAPTSINGQAISLVVVRDAAKRAQIAEICGGQAWVAKAPVFVCIVADYAKTHEAAKIAGETQTIHESLEGFAVGATDSGIALATLSTAARALGLGTVMIGAIRRDPQAIIDLLELPPLTFPMVGCCIGHFASEPQLKPRLPINTFRHDDKWQGNPSAETLSGYDETLMTYWKSIGRTDGEPWTHNTSKVYKQVYFPRMKPVAASQGFLIDK